MTYEVQTRSDLLSGATLSVTIPVDEIDKKALFTVLADKPDFVLPFHYRNIDGNVEFVYQIGSYSKLQYLSGVRSPGEYASLWEKVLSPLFRCSDWFMKPYSFLLSADHLYFDKTRNTVCYAYIPSVRDSSEQNAVRDMAAEVSRYVPVTDAFLENMVLRAIMRNFNPKEFLKMLEPYNVPKANVASPYPAAPAGNPEIIPFSPPGSPVAHSPQQFVPTPGRTPAPALGQTGIAEAKPGAAGDIVIDIPAKGKPSKKSKNGAAGAKNAYAPPLGANSSIVPPPAPPSFPPAAPLAAGSPNGQPTGSPNGQPTGAPTPPVHNPASSFPPTPSFPHAPVYIPYVEPNDVTQSVMVAAGGSRLRLVGSVLLPAVIDIHISPGGIFTIGRFDASVGRAQSDFEFEKRTKAVSRRHAAIEREADKYRIVDLSSSAGTFVNGQKLPPNAPYVLGNGCRVSFGNAGADYVWEESC